MSGDGRTINMAEMQHRKPEAQRDAASSSTTASLSAAAEVLEVRPPPDGQALVARQRLPGVREERKL